MDENIPEIKHVIRLNATLFSTMSRVFNMTNTELMDATGIKNATWYRLMGNPDEITVQQLISIANGLHIPVRRFFLFDDADMVASKREYLENPYKPCFYDAEKLLQVIDTQAVATWQEVADTLGISRSNLRNSLMSVTRLPLTRFLTACEVFGVDPFCAIIDPNPWHLRQRERKDIMETKQEYAVIQHDMATILREMAIFRAEFINIRRDIAELGKKIDTIIDTYHEELPPPKEAKRTAALARKIAEGCSKPAEKLIAYNEKKAI